MITYRAVVSACRKCVMPEWALQPFDEMQQQGLEPNVITYAATIRCSMHVESARPERALQFSMRESSRESALM